MRFKQLLFSAISLLLFNQAIAQSHLKIGIWRGALKNSAGNELPFNFEVKENAGKQQLIVMNGAERIKVTNIRFKGDSVLIHMPLFNSEFKLKSEATGLTGKWSGQDSSVPRAGLGGLAVTRRTYPSLRTGDQSS